MIQSLGHSTKVTGEFLPAREGKTPMERNGTVCSSTAAFCLRRCLVAVIRESEQASGDR